MTAEVQEPASPSDAPKAGPPPFHVVGVGASAGGLEALGDLLRPLPLDLMAVVVIQHLAPTQPSILAQLLARSTPTEVLTATNGVVVEPNHVYVIPPDTDLALLHGVLHLVPVGLQRPKLPIDYFFRSLAEDAGPFAVGVVLSGTGSDGTFGLQAIKAAGGTTFAQEPSSARYDGMPRSAIASGYADFSLTPKQIAAELKRIAETPCVAQPSLAPRKAQEQIAKLAILVRSAFGNDWSNYKPSTVERRIERRMAINRIAEIGAYVRFAQSNTEELRALHKDILITVTSFFRDIDPFEALKRDVLPRLFVNRDSAAPLRIWVPACATGEEAYSVTICLLEYLDEHALDVKVQIFATDIDEDSIQIARRGTYSRLIELDVSRERLDRFFVERDGDYVVSRRVRDRVTFSKQNLLKDAPFSRLDLLTCRNLLIYLQPAAQRKALRIAHHALAPSGFLMLGTSETVGDEAELFSLVDRKNKIYGKKHSAATMTLEARRDIVVQPETVTELSAPVPTAGSRGGLQAVVDRRVVELYGPPGVVVDENLEILLFRGRTGPYLDPSPGAASFALLRVARPELHADLQRIVRKTLSTGVRSGAELVFYEDGQPVDLLLEAVPVQDGERGRPCALVLFVRRPRPKEIPVLGSVGDERSDERLALVVHRNQDLERELATARDYLQAAIAERESATEEFRAAHEELQSVNEELQSTNEELETSKEEMLSANEELTNLNEELSSRMEELSQSNDDLQNLLTGVDHPIVIVGLDLCIRRYTAAAGKLLSIVRGDVGRSITFIEAFVGPIDIRGKVASAIDGVPTPDDELLCANHRWYRLRVTPYKTTEHSIRGAVVLLRDIDIARRAVELSRDVGDYASSFLGAIGHPLLILDARLRVVWGNDAFYESFDLTEDETIGSAFTDLGQRQWSRTSLVERLRETAMSGSMFRDHVVADEFHPRGRRELKISGSRLPIGGESVLMLVSIEEPFYASTGDRRLPK